MKKSYTKPELKTRKIELGVFGDYNGPNDGDFNPSAVTIVKDLDMHME